MDPKDSTLTPPPLVPAPSAGSGEEATRWETLRDHSPPTATSSPYSGLSPEPSASLHAIVPGQILAGRYKILGFIARGGMGEVYEALDLDLNEHLALKVLSRAFSESEEALLRFKSELSLARKVTHPNVCRTYDFFQYQEETGARVACLSMELLRGETLSQCLYRDGRMDSALVRALACQMTTALAAAHAVGVVHRDLKPSNIMLVPSSSGAASMRVVVTDFGLAFSEESLERGGSRFLGTPAYMSPEQVEFRPITSRSDIYALGLVIFEMLTGRVAFEGSDPISAATRRIKEAPPNPRLFVPDLDPFWDAVLTKCLALKPEDRYPNAAALLEVLAAPFPAPAAPLPGRRTLRSLALISATSLLLAGGTFGAWNVAKGRAPWAPLLLKTRPVVAILGFRNLGPEAAAWRGLALAEMLGTEMSVDGRVRIISGEEVARMKADLHLQEDDPFGPSTLAAIRKRLGVDLAVAGTFVDAGDKGGFRVDLKLIDVTKGQVLDQLRQEGGDRDIVSVVHGAAQILRKRMGLPEDSPLQREGLIAAYPKDPDGMRYYAQAVEKLRKFEPREAIALLEQALAKDASCALVHTALAEAWNQLGYDDKAKHEATTALGCTANLAREDRLRVEARSAQTLKNWDKAAEAYRTLFGFFPDNVDYGLGLATSLAAGAHPMEAARIFEQLTTLGGKEGPDPRIWMERAEAARATGDIPKAMALAELARTKAQQRGAWLLAARAQVRLASFAGMNGHLEAALRNLDDADKTFSRVGDLKGMASVLHVRCMVGRLNGSFDEVRKSARALERLAGSFGNLRLEGIANYMEGMSDEAQGAYSAALAVLERSEATLEQAGERHGILIPMMEKALILGAQGKPVAARQQIKQCLAKIQKTQDERQKPFALAILGQLELAAGRFKECDLLNREGLALGKKGSLGEEQVFNLENAAMLALWRGDLPQAAQAIQEARAVLLVHTYAKGKANLLWLDGLRALEAGNAKEALACATEAQTAFQAQAVPDYDALASLVISRAHLALGDLGKAEKALEAARPRYLHTEALNLRLEFALQAARLVSAQGKKDEAKKWLESGERWATKGGHLPYKYACQLLKAQLSPGNPGRLRQLELQLESLGFGLLANQARIQRADNHPTKLPA